MDTADIICHTHECSLNSRLVTCSANLCTWLHGVLCILPSGCHPALVLLRSSMASVMHWPLCRPGVAVPLIPAHTSMLAHGRQQYAHMRPFVLRFVVSGTDSRQAASHVGCCGRGSASSQLLSLRRHRFSVLPALSARLGPGGRVLCSIAVIIGQLCAWRDVLACIDAHSMVPIHQEYLGVAVGVSAAYQTQPRVTFSGGFWCTPFCNITL